MTHARCTAVWSVLALAACGSVEVPRERYFRLDLPAARSPDPGRAGVLRVQDLQLGTALDGDCLAVRRGVQLEPRPLDRWIAPLDRLVTDALVLGLSRARVCDLVKGAADAGGEHWSLHGRIVEFGEARGDHGAEARVTLELWLEERGELVFHDEFTAVEALARPGPEAAVVGLSTGLRRVVDEVVERMQGRGLFAAARPAARP
ncbi:MAG: membrane integrity-associated transporter subunit PqiC [Planctomycetes bacterium]|nr:membrane integrity-associated transporter subunit PqiC [Planctomycetota bacterium]